MTNKAVQLHTLKIEVAHGSDRHEISVFSNSPPTVDELMKELEKKTRVPYSSIQLIFKGQRLHANPSASLASFSIFSGNRLLMIGEKMNPTQDAAFRRILGIGKDVGLIEKSLNDSIREASLMENGGVERTMIKEYGPQLHQRACGMKRDFEAFLSVISELDANKLEMPEDVKKHQIQIINSIRGSIQKCEALVSKVSKLIK